MQPVYCNLCQSAVYCKSCIERWQQTKQECCYCKQTVKEGGEQFLNALERPEFGSVFSLTQIRCTNYPNCLEVHTLDEIEKHEQTIASSQAET